MSDNKIKRSRDINWFDTPLQNGTAEDNFINQDDEVKEFIEDRVGETNGVDANEEIDNRDNN